MIKKYFIRFSFSLLTFSFLLNPLPLLAQTNNIVNCFDYYRFGSISADLQAGITQTVSGVPVTFKGDIVNNNNYPVVDGTLYAKIFRVPGGGKDVNGPYVVDQFVVKDDIDLPANGKMPVTYTWKVPSYAISGEYKIATFFITSNKFNLLGLSFTNDIIGNSYSFKVNAEQNVNVELDKNTVTVNKGEYHFAAFPPRISKDEPGIVKANIINTTKADQVSTITYNLYSWDAQNEANLINSKSEVVSVKAGKTQEISYTVTDTKHSVYLLEITSTYRDTKSILNIRFVRQGINEPRINFPSVTSYPLKAGESNTLFSCFHNTADETVKDGKLVMSVKDDKGNIIHTATYAGDITGAMMGTKSDFIPKKDNNNFWILAELYSGGNLVDSIEVNYSCETLDPDGCQKEDEASIGSIINPLEWLSKNWIVVASGIILIVIFLVALILLKKKKYE